MVSALAASVAGSLAGRRPLSAAPLRPLALSTPCVLLLVLLGGRCILAGSSAAVAEQGDEETGEQLIARVGADLACSSCVQAVTRFRFDVSRHIKPKLSADEKTRLFSERLQKHHPCGGRHFHRDMVIAAKALFGPRKYMSYEQSQKKTGTAISGSGPKVQPEATSVCRYFVDGHRDKLLEAVIKQTKSRMNDVNFFSLLCHRPQVVCDASSPELDEDDEHMDEL
mmetsp:Transcript_168198/g.540364  ORF Transcript_168198/g.540364 Transcript_168198/m.540364 type:complete len:225 (-) Transcript_168198:37-711(-)